MADVNQVITLGIGTPSDIKHFLLMGLGGDAAAASGSGFVDMGIAQGIEHGMRGTKILANGRL